MTQNEYNS